MNCESILRLPQVEAATGLRRERIRQLEVSGRFPPRVRLLADGRAVGWVASEVDAWVRERIAAARGAKAAA